MFQLTNKSITLLLICGSLLFGCSSNSDKAAVSDNTNYRDGAPPNTGIAGQALASTESFTAMRPELIDLDYLTDANGFSTSTEAATEIYGRDFRALGDINGDGQPDFMFTTSQLTTIIFGGTDSLASIDLNILPAQTGLSFGIPISLKGIGDINNDGMDDIAWETYDSATYASGVRVVFGKRDSTLKIALQSPIKGVEGFDIFNSDRSIDIRSVSSAGDLNADGIDDLYIGGFALNEEDHTAPNAWVLYGSQTIGNTDIDVSQMTSGQGLSLISPLSDVQVNAMTDDRGTGYDASITGNFDLNGDGIDDIALGTERFDWIERIHERRTYVVFGSASRLADVVDLTKLDGENGMLIAAIPSNDGADPDQVISIGDLDGNGFNDLAIKGFSYGNYSNDWVLFGGTGITGAVVERTTIATGSAMRILDSDPDRNIEYASAIGDLDGNGAGELGIVYADGGAAIVYGEEGHRPALIDLAEPTNVDITWLQGMSDFYSYFNDNPLQALGDINGDGVDDLGIGWDQRAYDAAISVIDDINGDNFDDLQISQPNYTRIYLLRVLYGFGTSGFTGVLAGVPPTPPVSIVEENFFNALINNVDITTNFAIDSLNSMRLAGEDLGPTANACLGDNNSVQSGQINQFDCTADPVVFSFNWGGLKYGGVGEAIFSSASVSDNKAKTLAFGTAPLPSGYPGSNPHTAFVNYDADAFIELNNGRSAESDAMPKRVSCTIDVATRITRDNPEDCLELIRLTTIVLNNMFGIDSTIDDLTLMP